MSGYAADSRTAKTILVISFLILAECAVVHACDDWFNVTKKCSQGFADVKILILDESGEPAIVEPSPERQVELDRAQILPRKYWTESAFAGQRIDCRNNRVDLVCSDLRRE